jgi:hypothetical protein
MAIPREPIEIERDLNASLRNDQETNSSLKLRKLFLHLLLAVYFNLREKQALPGAGCMDRLQKVGAIPRTL